MSDYFIGEIRLFAGRTPPAQWAFCNGQTMPIAGNEALYALIGTIYGGDGHSNFGLPDFRGRIPVGQGQGVGLTNRVVGQAFGSETATITVSSMPNHDHVISGTSAPATSPSLGGGLLAETSFGFYADGVTPSGVIKNFGPTAIAATGGSQNHLNMMPTFTLNFIIALQGLYPTQN